MTKRWGVVMAAVAMALAGGCQRVDQPTQDRLITLQSAPDDAAMELRDDWEPSVVEYPNGAVVAGPTLYPYTARNGYFQQTVVDPLLFIGQTIILPVTFFTTPAWGTVVYQGVDFPDTDTAALPMTASNVQVPQPVPDQRYPASGIQTVAPVERRQVPRSVPRGDTDPARVPPATPPRQDTAPRVTPAPQPAPPPPSLNK